MSNFCIGIGIGIGVSLLLLSLYVCFIACFAFDTLFVLLHTLSCTHSVAFCAHQCPATIVSNSNSQRNGRSSLLAAVTN